MEFSVKRNWNNCTFQIPINYVNLSSIAMSQLANTREIDLRLNHRHAMEKSETTTDALRCKHLTPNGETYFT